MCGTLAPACHKTPDGSVIGSWPEFFSEAENLPVYIWAAKAFLSLCN
jgi:hypothetical protein